MDKEGLGLQTEEDFYNGFRRVYIEFLMKTW